jgi:hypothetical protein
MSIRDEYVSILSDDHIGRLIESVRAIAGAHLVSLGLDLFAIGTFLPNGFRCTVV